MFFNGMRDSVTRSGDGAPTGCPRVETIDVAKGPTSGQSRAGAGVDGSIGITSQIPSLTTLQGS